MKTMKKVVSKKPMMKANKGISVKDPEPVKGSKGSKASMIIAGISGAAAATAAAIAEARRRKKLRKAEEEKAKMEAEDKMKIDGVKPKAMYGKTIKPGMMKTGGMVNSNTKVSALKVAGSKGTKVGLNKKVTKPKK